MGDDLRVGLGADRGTVSGHPAAQLDVVLDDAVEHDVDSFVAVSVRMRVRLGHAAMRSPAGVSDPGRRLVTVGADAREHECAIRDGRAERDEVADRAYGLSVTGLVQQGDAGGVIAAVLELLQSR